MLNAGAVEDKLEGGNHRLELRNLESQFLGRLIRSLGVPKEERGVWGSRGGDRGLGFSRRRKEKNFFPVHFLVLSHKTSNCPSLELMITQQATQFKLCTKDYITIKYTA